MTEEQAVTQLLPILLQLEKKLSCHTLSKVEFKENKWGHVETKCPLCQAIWLLDKYNLRMKDS